MTHTYAIVVLLPVYNGARYLSEQIDSILTQTWTGDHGDDVAVSIVCRDDASSDDSPALLRDYALRYPGLISVLDDQLGNLGAAGNFAALMRHAASLATVLRVSRVYVALADQDDIWHANKLQRSFAAMLTVEAGDLQTPALVHSNLRVVDAGGNVVATSFMAYQGLRPARASLPAQLLSNTLTGCTAMMNLALIEKALPIPAAAVMHDWWLSLIASAFGKRVYLDAPLVDYRQHDSNTIGARLYTRPALSRDFVRELLKTHQAPDRQQAFAQIAGQAEAFLRRHGDDVSGLQRFVCRRIIALPHASLWWQRLMFRLLRLL